eukprot:2440268-Alexandrium_andersonii.AAC.1
MQRHGAGAPHGSSPGDGTSRPPPGVPASAPAAPCWVLGRAGRRAGRRSGGTPRGCASAPGLTRERYLVPPPWVPAPASA